MPNHPLQHAGLCRRQIAAQSVRSCTRIPSCPHALASHALLIDRSYLTANAKASDRSNSEAPPRPSGRLVRVTEIARIRNLQRLGLLRPNETKRVAAHFHVAESGDRGMTGSASGPCCRRSGACAARCWRHAAHSGCWGHDRSGTSRCQARAASPDFPCREDRGN